MTLEEIKSAVEAGKTVHWSNTSYTVLKDRIGQWLIHRAANDWHTGLTTRAGALTEAEEDFFIAKH